MMRQMLFPLPNFGVGVGWNSMLTFILEEIMQD